MAPSDQSVLLIDNYDSFTYIIKEYLGMSFGYDRVHIVKNDEVDYAMASEYAGWIISPGTGLPNESGRLLDLLKMGMDKVPILGICLGHQAIAEAVGGSLINLGNVRHGVQVHVSWFGESAISPRPGQKEMAGLYHSWVVDPESIPPDLNVLAIDELGHIMAIKYKDRPVFGVQFHPESILTIDGSGLIRRFLSIL
mgnify:CR=1 FL=1